MLELTDSSGKTQHLAQAIVDAIADPFLVLDDNFCVTAASRSFYDVFKAKPATTRGQNIFTLGDGQWNIPALRVLLEKVVGETAPLDAFEVEHDFTGVGKRVMLLSARKVNYEGNPADNILVAFRDITKWRAMETQKDALILQTEELLRREHILLQEIQHRVANSLQIIASILMLKARAVTSEEARSSLHDAHERVMSVSVVQKYLNLANSEDQIEVGDYLEKLCGGLRDSMISEGRPIELKVIADPGTIKSAHATSLGLIVTELVINAIKYAFPLDRTDARIFVTYQVDGLDWKLTVSDNGVGADLNKPPSDAGGLGSALVEALARQLRAKVEIASSATGMRVSITRVTFVSTMPEAT